MDQATPAGGERLLDQRRHLGVDLGHRSRLAIGAADRHGRDLDQVRIEPRDRRIGPHRRTRWRDTGEVPALRRGEHAAAGFVGRDHDVDERLPRTAAREVQRDVFAIGAGRREHDLDVGQIGRAADVEDAPPDRRHRLCESQVQVAGPGGAEQLLPERVRCAA